MPNQLRAVAQAHQSAMELFRLELAPPLVCLCPFIEKTLPMSRRGESRIAEILHDRVREALALATPEELGDGVLAPTWWKLRLKALCDALPCVLLSTNVVCWFMRCPNRS